MLSPGTFSTARAPRAGGERGTSPPDQRPSPQHPTWRSGRKRTSTGQLQARQHSSPLRQWVLTPRSGGLAHLTVLRRNRRPDLAQRRHGRLPHVPDPRPRRRNRLPHPVEQRRSRRGRGPRVRHRLLDPGPLLLLWISGPWFAVGRWVWGLALAPTLAAAAVLILRAARGPRMPFLPARRAWLWWPLAVAGLAAAAGITVLW